MPTRANLGVVPDRLAYPRKLQALSCLLQKRARAPRVAGRHRPPGAAAGRHPPLPTGSGSLDAWASRHGLDAHALRRMNPAFPQRRARQPRADARAGAGAGVAASAGVPADAPDRARQRLVAARARGRGGRKPSPTSPIATGSPRAPWPRATARADDTVRQEMVLGPRPAVAARATAKAHLRPRRGTTPWDSCRGQARTDHRHRQPALIANGIAEAMRREDAELAFTYQNEKLEIAGGGTRRSRIRFGHRAAAGRVQRRQIDACFAELGNRWDGFDILVHDRTPPREAIAANSSTASPARTSASPTTCRAYSLAALAKAAPDDGRPQRIDPDPELPRRRTRAGYNVMGVAKASLERPCANGLALGPEGIRVNAISAGPIKTLAAAASLVPQDAQPVSRRSHRCAAWSPSRTSATSPRSCARTWPPASPARSPMSTPATTSWG